MKEAKKLQTSYLPKVLKKVPAKRGEHNKDQRVSISLRLESGSRSGGITK